ncbi:hypothetical protein GGH94_002688 [Coemansia aciculifera]|uniref:Zn(2)-C6 fungal-type domain-containing protein n=1 Tax=Coemansia aciculifera TaxID=417176 RepID=A0A9W8M580_9FUNG|nr:hypothetical protein GGH94_002688 [Coemansia aciculifera]
MDDAQQRPAQSSKRSVTKSNGRGIPLLRSCERCRRRKQRCDGDQPACGRCAGQRAECKYRQSGRFRKRYPTTNKRASAIEAATTLSGMSTAITTPAIMFQVPELSPSSPMFLGSRAETTISPESRCMSSLINDGTMPMLGLIDPVEILKTRDLPDLTQGLPDGILQRMWALQQPSAAANSDCALPDLAPNLGLLDPHNSAFIAGSPQHKVPAALVSVAQRYGLPSGVERLLAMLRTSFVDSGMKIRTRQFWATLEAGRIGDFAVLAHLAIAIREANLTQGSVGLPEMEAACYAAARREWECGRVEPSTSAVFALLLLSEYGYQTGRPVVMSEFADHAISTAQHIVFRGAAYPWHSAPIKGACDIEREHLLACFWSAWVRVFTAAQVLGRTAPLPSDTCSFPAFPTHDMCHYTAQPVAGETLGAVLFPIHSECRHSAHGAYSAATWQCALLGAEMHNLWVSVSAGKKTRASYFVALRAWDRRLRLWRAAWPQEWMTQMTRIARLAQRVPHSEPLLLDAEWLADLGSESTSSTPLLPPTPDTRPVGAHLFHESRISAADAWLAVVFVMYDMTRLRAHRVALDMTGSQEDPLASAIAEHSSRAETLDAARGVQNVLDAVQRLGFPPERMGIWIVFVLEQAIDIHCTCIFQSADPLAQADALQRLAALLRHLLALKHWTAALYIFAALVKRHVEPSWLLSTQAASNVPLWNTATSPWPPTHVLTLLMRAMRMDPRQFCAYTMPVVYASVMSTPVMPQSMRMRIASLLS